MASTSSAGKYKRDNNTKNEVQDFGGSAIHVLRRQSIPNLLDLSNDMQPRVPHQHDRAIQRRRRTSTPVLNEISMQTINNTAVFEAALTLCRIQEKPCYVANSVTGNSKKVLQDEMKFSTTQGPKVEVGLRVGSDSHDRPGSVLDSGASKESPVSHPEDADGKNSPSISHVRANRRVAGGQHSAQVHEESVLLDRTPIMVEEIPSAEALRMAPAREPVRMLVRDATNTRVVSARQVRLPAGSRRNRQLSQQVSKQLWFPKHHEHSKVTLNAESVPVDLAVRHNSDSRPSSIQVTKVPQRMVADGTESILKARDRLAGRARVRSRGLKMSPMDAFKAAEIRRYRFFRLVAMQLRRSSQHAA